MSEHFRWIAHICFNTNSGPSVVDHHIEELEELQEIVERGPDWNSIRWIKITLNPLRRSYSDTVEQSEER